MHINKSQSFSHCVDRFQKEKEDRYRTLSLTVGAPPSLLQKDARRKRKGFDNELFILGRNSPFSQQPQEKPFICKISLSSGEEQRFECEYNQNLIRFRSHTLLGLQGGREKS